MPEVFHAFIGLGANLGEPARQLAWAITRLQALPHTRLDGVSRLYSSKPLGPADQPDYTNAAIRLQTGLTPHQLLGHCQAIEQEAGRVRLQHWGPRVLDLDILLYAHDEIRTASLIVPHPELVNRSFVVLPLLDLDAQLVLPNGQKLATLQAAVSPQGLCVSATADWWSTHPAE